MHRVYLILLFLCSLTAQSKDTLLKLYRPFNVSDEQANINIHATKSGQCLQQSKLILREDAWRCHANGKVYDPCFTKNFGNKKEALCPTSPLNGESTLITVSEPLNNIFHTSLDMSRAYPWVVILENGTYCQAIESKESYDHLPVHYRCQDNSLLLGHIQRCDPNWKMLQKKEDQIQTVSLAKVWF
ncbi:hypothetical protein FOG18_00445 [Legionella israelensis]|uniref:hypothetical protein n=1 Tax=Legionella israelensis TaxID=454 RepID=UPI00117C3DFA|nr:hypothetical protein [Legionella israelensis]QDP71159.1 hypothetical protein FOG18_00445 [Legionella israelensis]